MPEDQEASAEVRQAAEAALNRENNPSPEPPRTATGVNLEALRKSLEKAQPVNIEALTGQKAEDNVTISAEGDIVQTPPSQDKE